MAKGIQFGGRITVARKIPTLQRAIVLISGRKGGERGRGGTPCSLEQIQIISEVEKEFGAE